LKTTTRILAIATNPEDGASTRFRILQWASALADANFTLQLEPFYPASASRLVHGRRFGIATLLMLLRASLRRIRLLLRLSASADVLLIHRELFPLGWPVLLNRLRRFRGAILYDYDDAMFLPQRRGRGLLERLERLDTPARLMAMSHVVLAGNPFLAEYAARHARRVVPLPTCIDTERFKPAPRPCSGTAVVLGWIGSHTTSKYLEDLIPALERVAATTPIELYVVGCATPLHPKGVKLVQRDWSLDREVEDFQRCDIGVYPLWDDEWSRGKSGFKAIQFMACGVPVVASGVGVTREIVTHGENGFIASSEEEWVRLLSTLVADGALRRQFGDAGRRRVEERYSVRANAPVLLGALQTAMQAAAAQQQARPAAHEQPV
jgi:glycosyltransferase involved in cell wall biosynthesis